MHFPELWEQLKDWDERNFRSFRADYTIAQLEIRFQFEEECMRIGRPIRGKEFMAALRERFEESNIGK